MPFTVEVNNSSFPEGTEFAINGLGVIPNGSSIEVDEEMERAYIANNGAPLAEGESGGVKITGSSVLSEEDTTALLPPPVEVSEEETPEAVEEAPQGEGGEE